MFEGAYAAARTPRPTLRVVALGALGALLTLSSTSRAAPVLDTFGAPSGPTPFSARVLPTGADATWFNPALLLDVDPRIQFGVFAVRQSLWIDLKDRPPGVDVSEAIYDARAVNPDGTTRRLQLRPLPTAALRSGRGSEDPARTDLYIAVGAAVPIIPNRLAVGLHVLLPTRSFQAQSSAYPDEREQYFSNSLHYSLYGNRFATNLISLAAAARPFDGLSIGVGATASNEGRASNQVFVPDASDQGVTVINTAVEVHTRFRPYIGIDAVPLEPVHLAATVHLPYGNDTLGRNALQLWNFEYPPGQSSFPQGFDFESHASPLRAALGLGWRPDKRGSVGFAAAATVIWTRWSQFRDDHNELPLDPWLDTFSIAAGGVLRWGHHALGLDTTYVPSPVPEQSGRTNYVDSNRAGVATGYTLRWKLGGASFEGGAQLQVHRLLPRTTAKSESAPHPVLDEFPDSVDARTGAPIPDSFGLQTNNPGYPGYSSGGWLIAGGLSLAVLL